MNCVQIRVKGTPVSFQLQALLNLYHKCEYSACISPLADSLNSLSSSTQQLLTIQQGFKLKVNLEVHS
jgi:hypothetical protein